MPQQYSWETVAENQLKLGDKQCDKQFSIAQDNFRYNIENAVGLIRGIIWDTPAVTPITCSPPQSVLNLHPLSGHSFVACEVLNYLVKISGIPRHARSVLVGPFRHFYLYIDGHLIDPTYDEFEDLDLIIPYDLGIIVPNLFAANNLTPAGLRVISQIRTYFDEDNDKVLDLLRNPYDDATKIRTNLYSSGIMLDDYTSATSNTTANSIMFP